MKVKSLLWGFVVVVILIAICRAYGGEALLPADVDINPK